MLATLWCLLVRRLVWVWASLFLLVVPMYGQAELNLEGAIDTRVHSSPDSVARSIDAGDLARLAKEKGMRGLVLKNHWESTAALAYMVRKEVPGIEIFGGIVLDQSVGGINLEAVKRMTMMKGGWGRVVWLPTFDSESFVKKIHLAGAVPPVPVSKDGHLLPSVLELIDFMEALRKEGISVADINRMTKNQSCSCLRTSALVSMPVSPCCPLAGTRTYRGNDGWFSAA